MFIRGIFAVLALGFTGAGLAGAVLPGLPTVPFLLLAVACGRRGWPDLARRLEAHARWGPVLADWRRRRAVPRRAKWCAAAMMAASWTMLALASAPPLLLGLLGAMMGLVLAWLWRLPEPETPADALGRGGAGPCA